MIGIGGVGSWAVEALARSGIGDEMSIRSGDEMCLNCIDKMGKPHEFH